jgi:hypothetical protein
LATSVLVFTSQPSLAFALQSAAAPRHGPSWHEPPMQRASALAKLQTLPQAPQFDGSPCVFTSQPVEARWSQSAKPAWQFVIAQALDSQRGFAFSRLQAKPQVPQFWVLNPRLTSQPVAGSRSQLAKFGLQVPSVHVPCWHAGLALAGAGHASLQEPQ